MHVARESHAWFTFNLNTKISFYLQIVHCNIYTIYNVSIQSDPLHLKLNNPILLTWNGDEGPSTLVSGLLTTAPPLALPLSPYHTLQFKLRYLHRRHQKHRLCLGQ
jgi:hypothetical protein